MKSKALLVAGGAGVAALVALSGCFGSLPFEPAQSLPGTTTTIILVRHAERNEGIDPPLNEEGLARAEALKDALDENGVTAVYCTDFIRNRDTVQPLADELGLTLNLISPALFADTAATADLIVSDILANHAGGTAIWCGNKGQAEIDFTGINEAIYRRLGGTDRPPELYQDMYIAVVPDEGPVRFIKTQYGGPSSLD